MLTIAFILILINTDFILDEIIVTKRLEIKVIVPVIFGVYYRFLVGNQWWEITWQSLIFLDKRPFFSHYLMFYFCKNNVANSKKLLKSLNKLLNKNTSCIWCLINYLFRLNCIMQILFECEKGIQHIIISNMLTLVWNPSSPLFTFVVLPLKSRSCDHHL